MADSIFRSVRKSSTHKSVGYDPPMIRRYSPAVISVANKFPNQLGTDELNKIAAVVDPMVKSGNWDKVDFLIVFAMADSGNALVSWKGTKTATGVGSPTHTANQGYESDIGKYINTGIDLGSDLTNGIQDDLHIASYCYSNATSTAFRFLFGVNDGTNETNLQQVTGNIRWQVNSSNVSQNNIEAQFQALTRYEIHRSSAANQALYKNGSLVESEADASTGVPAGETVFIGGENNNGSFANQLNAVHSYWLVGGGFDLTALNNELNILESEFIV